MNLFPCPGGLLKETQAQGGLISSRVHFFPPPPAPPVLSQALPFPKTSPSSMAQLLRSHPSQTPLSLFCPHRTGDTGNFHLAPLGGTAELPCPLALWPVSVPTAVTWLRSPHPDRSQAVHVFRDGKDREEGVMPEYKGRTAMRRDAREGSVSLEIRQVRLEDRGQYRCQVQIGNLTREGTVTLQVAG